MIVNYIMRSSKNKAYSIEKVFSSVSSEVSKYSKVKMTYMPCAGASLKSIVTNMIAARKCRGDVIHITGEVHYAALVTPKHKTIITVHDMVTLENSKGIKRMVLKLLWFTLPLYRCEKIVAISPKTKNDIIKVFPHLGNKITVIPDPVDSSFKYTPKDFNSNKPRILQIGTKTNKNIERVIEAIKGIDCVFVIVGKLSEKQVDLLKANNIHYENDFDLSDEEIIGMYSSSDLVVFASTYEGFGMPIIEAQSIGRPVVTSNIEPMKSVSGSATCLVNPYSAESIRKGINRVINDSKYRDELIVSGLNNSRKYSSATIGKRYYQEYCKLCTSRKSKH